MIADVEVSSETSLCQNTHKKGVSRGTRNTSLASDTEAEYTAEGKTSVHRSGFSASDAAREKPSRKRRLMAYSESEVSEKDHDEYADFKRLRAVPKHAELKWDLSENLAMYKNDNFN